MKIPTEAEIQEAIEAICLGCHLKDEQLLTKGRTQIEAWFNGIRQLADVEREAHTPPYYFSRRLLPPDYFD